jgi:hypothetical protein
MEERALERFGLQIGKTVRQTLVQRVHRGEVKYARRLTRSRTVIVLDYAGREIAFVYSNTTREIVTFRGPGAPETADWRNSQAAARALFGHEENAG